MNVLDLFSGIGGFSLGLERAGMRTVAFCEIDPYCQAVLRKHWPDVPVWGDIREFSAEIIADTVSFKIREQSGWRRGESWWRPVQFGQHGDAWIDLICGGFPCQDISVAGKGAGIDGERSGLWSEFARIIGEVRPRYVIVENVAALLGRGIGRVLGDLAALGYDAEWHCVPASAVGAPHRRDRVWIVAHTRCQNGKWRANNVAGGIGADAQCSSQESEIVAHCDEPRSQGFRDQQIEQEAPQLIGGRLIGNSDWWFTEPNVGRVAHGIPFRVDRIRSLGNAIVPQIAEIIGKAIMEVEHG